jgi:PAS domain S-box-containing protein
MADSESYLSALSQASDAILITDADLKSPGPRILFANESFCQLTGYSAEELIARSRLSISQYASDAASLDARSSDHSEKVSRISDQVCLKRPTSDASGPVADRRESPPYQHDHHASTAP